MFSSQESRYIFLFLEGHRRFKVSCYSYAIVHGKQLPLHQKKINSVLFKKQTKQTNITLVLYLFLDSVKTCKVQGDR